MNDINAAPAGAALCACAADPNRRILQRVYGLDDFPLAARGASSLRRVALVDTETTGTDVIHDEIIDIAVVVIEINGDGDGDIVGIAKAGQALRDPHMPIPSAITRLTGITDADVAGKTIDLDRLERLLASADVRIAHLAAFDIAFVENLMPGLAGASWACSMRDFDWPAAGFDGAKLGYLLTQIGRFNDAHRAMADVVTLLHLLAHRLDDGATVLGRLLERAERPSLRIEATGAGFDKRASLKSRGYRWDARAKVWWLEIDEADRDDETRWLVREAGLWGTPKTRPITWHERHR